MNATVVMLAAASAIGYLRPPNNGGLIPMAFLLTHFWPGGTEEQYLTMIAAVHPPDGLPAGQVHHAAGETEGGYLISVVWDAKESSDKFVSDVLLASLPVEGGFEGQPEERGAEISHLETA